MYEATALPRELATWVAATWQETVTVGSHADGVHPDGAIDILWDGSGLIVYGPRSRSEATLEAGPAVSIGVRLRPGSTRAMLGETADALADRTVPLGDLWGKAAEVAAMRLRSVGGDRVMSEFSAVLMERGRAGARPDHLIRRVVQLARDRWTVRNIAREVGLSERQLFRRCLDEVGYGPKHLVRVLRLQRLLGLARRLPDAGLAALAIAAGYADQAHMSRECRSLTGLTPARLVRSQRHLLP
ncbi:MAG TPA: AraC family transcriptional regulator [Candidatus Bathyarchaeia archaeon]|nr:AraC family transcriptional regulator [Candidatus Bathyarchaeia archaeon]